MKIKAGIVGGAGYTGGETLRILINHPSVEIKFVHSNSNAGNPVSAVHADLYGDTDLRFTNSLSSDIDVLFLCVGHGAAKEFLESNDINKAIKIIDLSQDFRLKANAGTRWAYGLPELNREAIKESSFIANPGCFATCIQLGLLPLAAKGLLKSEIHINATTGSTGAGQSLSTTAHFSWRNNNLSVYKVFEHQHLNEIGESLKQLNKKFDQVINFIPQRGDFARGILAAMYLESDLTTEEAQRIYQDYYAAHPFTHVSKKNIDLKQVVNTNKALVHVEKHGAKLFIVSIIDNLLKGASGQAVQNMNLMFGLEETEGLRLKAVAF
ncbi:MAG: N-acetyl-gamma-glutamyl-phosphate reductase [Candidatus Pedobacter colombiensis]|uniref:N-acetyl-gamma-glutamyl-phosphate reductase n=1 Tax=Candidatus Pedobacter colombiensis TaxID=3121371 RepID=A0AAJ5W8V3_9SPHI|nr:N-acetyl-gamma-glutamyl-phosphate reductase [Pedobacter sp.]WEK19225.1 MAG: N-acetyl-gamma-glutamyl-phosphate reductase [Pedobacter sp.]